MVFMSWLIILQLFTIGFAYTISEKFVESSSKNLKKIDDNYGKGCITLIVVVGIFSIFMKIYHDRNFSENTDLIQKAKNIDNSNSETLEEEINSYKSVPENGEYIENYDVENTEPNHDIYTDDKNINVFSQKEVITEFINAENSRDISRMNEYLSPSLTRFWKYDHPSFEQVKESYYKTWYNYNYTNTEIIEIENVKENLYKVNVKFQYDSKIRNSFTYFEIDENNKIIQIY